MTYRVDISGLDDLIEAIEEAKKLDDVKEVVKNDTAYMANQIAEETPVRSGYWINVNKVDTKRADT
ncbi:hypothetical protein ACE4ZY_010690 [Enterococcus faecalis]|uniref:hypothetical protein n=1 Tax=Enterococcus faecalis TaxID=1351 RepID=UPI0035F04571